MKKLRPMWLLLIVLTTSAVALLCCDNPTSGDVKAGNGPKNHTAGWTWVSGSNLVDQHGSYGMPGTTSPSNVPGARFDSVSWIDASGNLWLFGGDGYDSANAFVVLNDLWRFDGASWTWVSGSNTVNENGSYGSPGVASPSNVPGARCSSFSWIDTSGNLWLFGGFGYDSAGILNPLNDLWKFDGKGWTWVSGSNLASQYGSYDSRGAASPSSFPGARSAGVSWTDASGNLWLFGGAGYGSPGPPGDLNDLWKFDGTSWTWVSGSKTVDQSGSYGSRGEASPSNVPGARDSSVIWIDASGNLWLFGGYGYDSAGTYGSLNDLWKFDGASWTWVSGSDTVDQRPSYGSRGFASPSNVPGARGWGVGWIDASGNFWLFGGEGYDSVGYWGMLNDLWKFDGTSWTWVSGSDTLGQYGNYGSLGAASPSNIPGARIGSVGWTDASGNFWFFGGDGYGGPGTTGFLNDVWRYGWGG